MLFLQFAQFSVLMLIQFAFLLCTQNVCARASWCNSDNSMKPTLNFSSKFFTKLPLICCITSFYFITSRNTGLIFRQTISRWCSNMPRRRCVKYCKSLNQAWYRTFKQVKDLQPVGFLLTLYKATFLHSDCLFFFWQK